MGNFLKFGLIGLGVCLVLFVISAVIFAAVFDPNDYKGRISQAVLKETGRTLTFDGDISLTFFPGLGVTLGGLSLSNAEGFGPAPMASVRSARVTVRLLPLLMGKVRFNRLELDGPVLNLGRDEKGGANWDDLVGREPDKADKADQDEDAGSGTFDLDVAGVAVRNGSLSWDDRKSDTRFLLRGLDVTTGAISKGGLFPVKLSVNFDCSKPDAKGALTLEGKSSIDLASRQYGHMDVHATVKATGAAIPGGVLDGKLNFQFLALDFNKETAQVTGLECTAYGATLLADGTIRGLTDGLKAATASLTLQPADLRTVFAALGAPAPNTADPKALTEVGGTAKVNFKTGRLALDDVELSVDGCRIVGKGTVERGRAWPRITAQVDAGEVDLDRYLPPKHGENEGAAQEQAKAGGLDDTVLPAGVIRRLEFDLDANAAGVKIGGAKLGKTAVTAKAEGGLVTVDPMVAEAYGGTVKVSGTVDARQGAPVVRIRSEVVHLDVGALAGDVTGKSEYAGIADYTSSLNAQGERMKDLLGTLGGEFTFKLSDGVFPGVDLVGMARTTQTAKGRDTVESDHADSTKFGSITGTGTIKDGVVTNQDLEVMAPGLRADGHGAFSLVTRQIDYMVKAKLVPTGQGQGGKSSDELFGVMVPIHVTGTLDKPHYWVSVKEYAKALGGVVVDTVGTVLGGVKNVVKGVGSALDKSCCEDGDQAEEPERKKFLGIF
ncbi:AsmA family protein [Pseudodesulfovibrio mercurii]|uniref:AsmA family protein n=1 Tax=Pseudodesulfovibrio mercurii TaxID=641491 RepID=F0JBI4_9BACT|nr:AsmA family protein [Pseudodesulfovibrio mercurii]EGB14303.1 AsmA family protein [Pseudodesulfovibrio mercurii]